MSKTRMKSKQGTNGFEIEKPCTNDFQKRIYDILLQAILEAPILKVFFLRIYFDTINFLLQKTFLYFLFRRKTQNQKDFSL